MYVLLSVLVLVVIVFKYLAMKSSQELADYQSEVEGNVDSIFTSEDYKPEIKAERVYGIPSFVLLFTTDKEKNHAIDNGLTILFLEQVQKLCSELKPRGEKYDAKRAVAIYSKEDESRWAQEAKILREQGSK